MSDRSVLDWNQLLVFSREHLFCAHVERSRNRCDFTAVLQQQTPWRVLNMLRVNDAVLISQDIWGLDRNISLCVDLQTCCQVVHWFWSELRLIEKRRKKSDIFCRFHVCFKCLIISAPNSKLGSFSFSAWMLINFLNLSVYKEKSRQRHWADVSRHFQGITRACL